MTSCDIFENNKIIGQDCLGMRRTSAGSMIVIELSVIHRSLMTAFAVQSKLNSILELLSSFL